MTTSPSALAAWDDLVPGAERQELADTARRHFAEQFPLTGVRECFGAGGRPLDRWVEIVEAGYPVIGLPESAGGIGGLTDLVAVVEESGRALLPLPLAATAAGRHTLIRGGLGVPAETDRSTALTTDPAAGVLDGAGAATVVTVAVVDDATTRVAEVTPAGAPELVTHVDPSRPVARWSGSIAEGRAQTVDATIDHVLAPARTIFAADLVGIAAGALQRSVDHALAREQFGRPIGAFQAVKHRLADHYVLVERARSLTRAAAVVVDHPELDTDWAPGVLALLAKAAAAEAALRITATHVQLLGAMGVTFEADAHLYFRRAEQTASVLGSTAECQIRAVRLMGTRR
ncbi:acyl-CoA dehydrogenase family protein [Nakamurella lactea]|uniref:acyl-CoA dehydrogenase family protein n=1 Tax=Nakamurella lactea TaxID=459515 RepID=UPI000427F3B6|nr:acyl-CoA dehydrogenase family protein [Nakamurella lactea]